MKLVLATPLYPPDRAEPAPYVKELAQRLSVSHDVTVVAYGKHLEQIAGVTLIPVDKHRPLPLRLLAFYGALKKASRNADMLIAENGASVELPAGILARVSKTQLSIHRGDTAAHERAATRPILGVIERFAERAASRVIDEKPLPRPEILPFAERPTAALAEYEISWERHLATITNHG